MSALFSVFPFLSHIFRPVIAAPTGLQGTLVTRVPEALRPLMQGTVDFLDPHHTPSLKQTIISCLTLLSISIFIISPTSEAVAKAKRENLLFRFKYDLTAALLGLLSPDYIAFKDYKNVFIDFFVAVKYNLIFRTEDRKKRWTSAHTTFMDLGGFVLQEDGKPTKLLGFGELVRMIKAGEIEQPDVSNADILARSIRPSISRYIVTWLSYVPIYWFFRKFSLKLPLVVVFVGLHALLTWQILLVRSASITGIKEQIAVVRRSQGDSVTGGEVFAEPADVEKVVGEMQVIADSWEKDHVHAPSPDQTGDRLPGSSTLWLLALPFEFIGLVFGTVLESFSTVYLLSEASLEYQWVAMSGPRNLGSSGTYVAIMVVNFVTWIGFIVLGWPLSYDVERKIWTVSALFLLLQPLILLLVRPQTIRMKVKESIRRVVYVLYTFVYVVARLSIPFAALYSVRKAM